jgi:hypothetical protein
VNCSEAYRGFTIGWQEPPLTSAAWTANNVASDDPSLNVLMGIRGSKVIDRHTRDEMIALAKAYIDSLFR